jgi:THO complex subunit 4
MTISPANRGYPDSRRGPAPRRRRDESPDQESRGFKIRVENIHYELTEEDLEELFWRIGKVAKLQLRYDRSGRSEGVAFVTYDRKADATEAIRQFDGANANGQPIKLSLMQGAPSRNPFDTAVMPGKPLSERVSAPKGRSRSFSPRRRNDGDDSRRGIDRYMPEGGSRSRSPMPRQRGGRRPGARREGGGRGQEAGGRDREGGREGGRGNPRSKKTQEELDAEMEDYFGGNSAPAANASGTDAAAPAPAATAAAAAPAAHADDIDMIE